MLLKIYIRFFNLEKHSSIVFFYVSSIAFLCPFPLFWREGLVGLRLVLHIVIPIFSLAAFSMKNELEGSWKKKLGEQFR